jgi:AraC-like DNA-binding protein
MAILRQFDPLVINDYVTGTYQYATHGHTYYELIYIGKGKGTHLLNNNSLDYRGGDLFLISPDDRHHFEVTLPTRFIVIKFTDDYFNQSSPGNGSMNVVPQAIMRMPALKEIKPGFSQMESVSLKNTILNIAGYKDRNDLATSPHVYFQLLSVFALIREALINSPESTGAGRTDKQQILSYIHEHIYDPGKCRIKSISGHFNISATYFGDFFKRTFAISYRDYIHQYRTRLIEKRVKSGKLSMKQIAQEFGFSDESHFSNYFKKRTAHRPVSYKKNNV